MHLHARSSCLAMVGVHVQEQCSLDDQPVLAVQSVQAISLTDEVASAAQRAVLFTQGQARKLCKTEGKARRLLREEASKEAHHRLYMWPHADLYVAHPDLQQ